MELQSENVTELIGALVEARKEITGASKEAENPFFGSKYADLSEVIRCSNAPLLDHGLILTQATSLVDGKPHLVTQLTHLSGEWIRGCMPIVSGKPNDPQSFGAALTYARRYGQASLLNIPQLDCDAEGAMDRNGNKGKEEKADYRKEIKEPKTVSKEKSEQIQKLFTRAGYSVEAIGEKLFELYGVETCAEIPVSVEKNVVEGLMAKIKTIEGGN